MNDPLDTIVAVSTPPGRGAIAVIRTSGPKAAPLVSDLLRPRVKLEKNPRRALARDLVDDAGNLVDHVVATYFQNPRSYTGEDVVEISCHGSPAVTSTILRLLLGQGLKPAQAGEFTFRAFLHGKMDLAQAEAVRALVASQTELQARLAAGQVGGRLGQRLEPVRRELVRIVSHLETAVEFAEEGVAPDGRENLGQGITWVETELERMEATFGLGRLVQEGALVTLAGRPNTGKSSLFNALLEEDRAIVTVVPGTTRDALAETVSLNGVPARLVDTAGIRPSGDLLEQLGIGKSLDYLRRSDVVCFVVDGSTRFEEADWHVWEAVRGFPCVLVENKSDLPRRIEVPLEVLEDCQKTVRVSALRGTNLEELRAVLAEVVWGGQALSAESIVVGNLRQQDCLRRARELVRLGGAAYREGLSEEFPLYHLRKALAAMGEVTGGAGVEEILDAIFSTFCIGK